MCRFMLGARKRRSWMTVNVLFGEVRAIEHGIYMSSSYFRQLEEECGCDLKAGEDESKYVQGHVLSKSNQPRASSKSRVFQVHENGPDYESLPFRARSERADRSGGKSLRSGPDRDRDRRPKVSGLSPPAPTSLHSRRRRRRRPPPPPPQFRDVPREESRTKCCLGVNEEGRSRRCLLMLSLASLGTLVDHSAHAKSKNRSPYDEKRLLQQNKKMQEANNAPEDFPNFIREGFDVQVVTSESYITSETGLIYRDIEVGNGDFPKDGQQVTFHYTGYNESGRRIDSTYLQGTPAKIRLGNKALVPGFEEGIRNMRPGGKRRIIIPPELGPPVGPSTFFSAKQFEVFDVELLNIKDCQRRTIGFYSDVVCD